MGCSGFLYGCRSVDFFRSLQPILFGCPCSAEDDEAPDFSELGQFVPNQGHQAVWSVFLSPEAPSKPRNMMRRWTMMDVDAARGARQLLSTVESVEEERLPARHRRRGFVVPLHWRLHSFGRHCPELSIALAKQCFAFLFSLI